MFRSLYEAYRDISLVVAPKRKASASRDQKDNIFLECALEAKADYIITGDHHLLEIGNVRRCSYSYSCRISKNDPVILPALSCHTP